jgi:hypothetical protein
MSFEHVCKKCSHPVFVTQYPGGVSVIHYEPATRHTVPNKCSCGCKDACVDDSIFFTAPVEEGKAHPENCLCDECMLNNDGEKEEEVV